MLFLLYHLFLLKSVIYSAFHEKNNTERTNGNIMKYLDITKKNIKARVICNPHPWEIQQHFKFYLNNVQPLVLDAITQKQTQSLDGLHGFYTHTNAVVFRGIDYALSINKDPLPVILACAFHDMARTNDKPDFEHGKAAVPMAFKIMNQFPDKIDAKTRASIASAIANHTAKTPTVAPDYISACLWDADRTRLAWASKFDEQYFSTQRGAHVASHSWKKYIEFQQSCFPKLIWGKQY